MPIPETIRSFIDKGLSVLDASSAAVLDRAFRAEVYAEIECAESTVARNVRANLALSSAQKVFSQIKEYDTTDYWDHLLSQAMDALTALARGQAKPDDVGKLTDNLYHAIGNWSMMFEDHANYPNVPGQYTLSADFAAMTVYKALGEANGDRRDPFKSLGNFQQVGTVQMPQNDARDKGSTGIVLDKTTKPGTQFDEMTIAGLAGVGDAAGAAACAYAFDDFQSQFNAERLAIFWRWWLTEALLEAYRD